MFIQQKKNKNFKSHNRLWLLLFSPLWPCLLLFRCYWLLTFGFIRVSSQTLTSVSACLFLISFLGGFPFSRHTAISVFLMLWRLLGLPVCFPFPTFPFCLDFRKLTGNNQQLLSNLLSNLKEFYNPFHYFKWKLSCWGFFLSSSLFWLQTNLHICFRNANYMVIT